MLCRWAGGALASVAQWTSGQLADQGPSWEYARGNLSVYLMFLTDSPSLSLSKSNYIKYFFKKNEQRRIQGENYSR